MKSLLVLEAAHRALDTLQCVLPLVRYFKPEIDTYPQREHRQWNLIKQACDSVNHFLDGLRKLQGVLE